MNHLLVMPRIRGGASKGDPRQRPKAPVLKIVTNIIIDGLHEATKGHDKIPWWTF